MEKPKILITVSGGIVQTVLATSDVEIIILDKDNHSLETERAPETILTPEELKKFTNERWADVLQSFEDEQVEVQPDNNAVFNEFIGFLEEIKQNPDGSYYATVEDMEGESFDIDVEFVKPYNN